MSKNAVDWFQAHMYIWQPVTGSCEGQMAAPSVLIISGSCLTQQGRLLLLELGHGGLSAEVRVCELHPPDVLLLVGQQLAVPHEGLEVHVGLVELNLALAGVDQTLANVLNAHALDKLTHLQMHMTLSIKTLVSYGSGSTL